MISEKVHGTFAQLDRLCSSVRASSNPEITNATSSTDQLNARFRVWSENIGASQAPTSRGSLDYRIRDAPRMKDVAVANIKRLHDSTVRATQIVTGELPNRTRYKDNDLGIATTELEKLLSNGTSAVKQLMRLSILLRRQRPRGRLPDLSTLNSDPSLDIRHVRDKFPKAAESLWLVKRLGTFNAQRRDLIQYRQIHRAKLAKRPEEHGPDAVVGNAPSTLATTFDPNDPRNVFEETMSTRRTMTTAQTSFASISIDRDTGDLFIPQLNDMVLDEIELQYNEEAECPYCRTIRVFCDATDWRSHVFSDLRPYVCTSEGCDAEPFPTRHEWIEHETRSHYSHWICDRCDNSAFLSEDELVRHLTQHHPGAVTATQFSFVVNACEKPRDDYDQGTCPLCNDWVPSQSKGDNGSSYYRHLGRHLQQLALSAIPTWIDGLEIRNATQDIEENREESGAPGPASRPQEIKVTMTPGVARPKSVHLPTLAILEETMSNPGTNPEESDDESSSTEGRDDRTLQKIRDNLGLMKLPEGKDPMRERASVPPPPAERSPMLDMPPKYEDAVGDPGQDGLADYFSRLADYGDGDGDSDNGDSDSDEELNIEPSTEDLSAWAPISEEHSTDERNPGETSTKEQRLGGSHNPHVDDGRFDGPDPDSARIPPHSTQLDRQSMSTSKPPWFLSRVRDDRFRRQRRRSGSNYIGHH